MPIATWLPLIPSSHACGIAIAGPLVCNPVGYSISRSITLSAYPSDTNPCFDNSSPS